MRTLAVASAALVLAAACGDGDAGSPDDAEPAVTTSEVTDTTTAPDLEATTSTTSTTTTEAPVELGAPEPGEVSLVVDGGTTVLRPDGVASEQPYPGCLSPSAAVSATRLLLVCDDDSANLTSLELDGTVAFEHGGLLVDTPAIMATGDGWFLACAATPGGPCVVREAGSGAEIGTGEAIPAPEPGEMSSGLGSLLVVSRGGERWLHDIATGTVVRSGGEAETWGGLVELADGTIALAVEISTGGDSRPEEMFYVDPATGARLGYDDGADRNSIFGVGPDVLRITPDLNVQKANVRGFAPDGTERWAVDDRATRATGSDGRVWLYTTGSPTVTEIDPATGEPIDLIELPGPVLRDFESVQSHGDWLVARVDGELGDAIVVVRV